MKKIIALIIIAATLLTIASFGQKKDTIKIVKHDTIRTAYLEATDTIKQKFEYKKGKRVFVEDGFIVLKGFKEFGGKDYAAQPSIVAVLNKRKKLVDHKKFIQFIK